VLGRATHLEQERGSASLPHSKPHSKAERRTLPPPCPVGSGGHRLHSPPRQPLPRRHGSSVALLAFGSPAGGGAHSWVLPPLVRVIALGLALIAQFSGDQQRGGGHLGFRSSRAADPTPLTMALLGIRLLPEAARAWLPLGLASPRREHRLALPELLRPGPRGAFREGGETPEARGKGLLSAFLRVRWREARGRGLTWRARTTEGGSLESSRVLCCFTIAVQWASLSIETTVLG